MSNAFSTWEDPNLPTYDLHKMTRSPNFLKGFETIYLAGSSGSGKSHLLAVLACQLIREGKRVVYIPDCRYLLGDFVNVMKDALLCAFYNSPLLKNIESIRNIDELFQFWNAQEGVHFIVDQLNVLELGGYSQSLDEQKKNVTFWLGKMKYKHKYIFSASADEKSNRLADMKQDGITVIRINGGMSQEEMVHWFAAKLPLLSIEQHQIIEHLTGRIPLLLLPLFGMQDFNEQDFLDHEELRKVKTEVSRFFMEKDKELNKNKFKRDMYFAMMEACLEGCTISHNMPELCDLRYFYADDREIGHCTCGVAFEAMKSIFRDRHRWFPHDS